MNKGNNVRRGRAKSSSKRGSNGSAGNRVDNKSRGNPKQNMDKYVAMARDARQVGDRVTEEYYLQFSDHFQRLLNESENNNSGHKSQNAKQRKPVDDEAKDRADNAPSIQKKRTNPRKAPKQDSDDKGNIQPSSEPEKDACVQATAADEAAA